MGNFNRDSQFNKGRDFNRRDFSDRRDRPMHKATCSKCGNECEVPFKPTGVKPVFCNQCFDENRGSDSRRSDRGNFRRSNFEDRQMYEAVCDTCGNKCTVPFQPTSGKPIYCSKCFEGKNNKPSRNTEQYKQQFEQLNNKLDKILNILMPTNSPKASLQPKMAKEVKPKKQIDKTKVKKTAVKKTTSSKKK